ncbi:MAG: hypothetical protein ACLP1X_09130 [Polyangiaceae bacterium]
MRRCSASCWRSTALTATLAGLVACGHAVSLEGDVLEKGGVRIHVGPVPPTWRRIQVEGADLAFRDDAKEGSALFDVRCGRRDDDAPLTALTEHLIMGTTQREFASQEVLPFDRREAMHTLLRANLDGVPMQYDIYVMKKDGCVVDLVYVAPPNRFADGTTDFQRFALGMHVLSDSPAAAAGTSSAQ